MNKITMMVAVLALTTSTVFASDRAEEICFSQASEVMKRAVVENMTSQYQQTLAYRFGEMEHTYLFASIDTSVWTKYLKFLAPDPSMFFLMSNGAYSYLLFFDLGSAELEALGEFEVGSCTELTHFQLR